MKVITDNEVEELLDMKDVINIVEKGFMLYSLGKTTAPARTRINVEESSGDILIMPCLAPDLNIFSTKLVTVFPKNFSMGLPTIHAVIIAIDPTNGIPYLVSEARALTGLRTGAATAVSIKHLARNDSRTLGIVGCGYQAKWQLLAASKMMNFDEIKIFDIDREKMHKFKESFKNLFDNRISLANSVDELAKTSDIIITATTSSRPFIKKGVVRPGTHISAIGAYTPEMAEIEPELVASSKLVVDSREAALQEAGDIIQAIKMGFMTSNNIYAEIGEIIAGKKLGRTTKEEITLFKSVGLSIQDAAVTSLLVNKLMSNSHGECVNIK